VKSHPQNNFIVSHFIQDTDLKTILTSMNLSGDDHISYRKMHMVLCFRIFLNIQTIHISILFIIKFIITKEESNLYYYYLYKYAMNNSELSNKIYFKRMEYKSFCSVKILELN
jgi:hypothetical protein